MYLRLRSTPNPELHKDFRVLYLFNETQFLMVPLKIVFSVTSIPKL